MKKPRALLMRMSTRGWRTAYMTPAPAIRPCQGNSIAVCFVAALCRDGCKLVRTMEREGGRVEEKTRGGGCTRRWKRKFVRLSGGRGERRRKSSAGRSEEGHACLESRASFGRATRAIGSKASLYVYIAPLEAANSRTTGAEFKASSWRRRRATRRFIQAGTVMPGAATLGFQIWTADLSACAAAVQAANKMPASLREQAGQVPGTLSFPSCLIALDFLFRCFRCRL